MENKEGTRAAEAMRRYIVAHYEDEDIAAAQVAAHAGYSERHGNRVFRAATGKSIAEYIRLLRLSAAAGHLAEGPQTILDVALDHQYNSHEGFTKAFSSAFGITPSAYREGSIPIQYFVPYPVQFPLHLLEEREEPVEYPVTATILQRPARKLVLLHSKTGTDYWTFCQEQGCDWEGLLLSITSRMDLPAFLTLPPAMVPKGYAVGAVGVEVPAGYAGKLPDGYAVVDLPAGEMIHFQTGPYAEEDGFAAAIRAAFGAYERYQPELYGYRFITGELPVFNFGATAEMGARIAVPLQKV